MNTTINALHNLTYGQLLVLASSYDIDASQFATRAIRLLTLSLKNTLTEQEYTEHTNLFYVISQGLANEVFVAHLNVVLTHEFHDIPTITATG